MSKMDFECLKDKAHKFTLDKPDNIEGNWLFKGVVHCPYCGSGDIQLDVRQFLNLPLAATDLNKARKENREQTMLAKSMAGEALAKDRRNNPEVSLTPIQGAGRFGGDTIKVKKDLFEKIRKATPSSALIAGGGDITEQ